MADKRSHQDSTGQDRDTQVEDKAKSNQESTKLDSGVTPTTNQTGATSTYTRRTRSTGNRKKKVVKDPTIPHFGLGIFSSQEDSYETTHEKNTEEDDSEKQFNEHTKDDDVLVPAPVEETNNPSHSIENIIGSVDSHKDVDETIEAEEYPVPCALNETKNHTPSINEIIRRASAPVSKSLSDTRKLEMIIAAAKQVEKNSKVVEAVPISIISPDWNIASTTGGLLMLEKNECTMPPPVISKEADELDEELTKTIEKILNEKPKRRNLARIHQLPERFRKLLFEFGKIVWADRTTFYSIGEGTWIENSIIDAWAVILNKEEAKSDSSTRIFFGVSSFISQLNPYCLSCPELIWLSKPSCYAFCYGIVFVSLDKISRCYEEDSNKDDMEFAFYERLALELEEQGLTVASLLAAKAFRFFKSYIACVFPGIQLVSTQYTFTEVKLPSHKDKTPNGEDCGIYTMHHMERYDGGEYEDGTTLDFNIGNIKDYRWKYIIRILMYPVNKNKNKILETMHQFYTNTAEEKQKEIPDHVDLSSES
ncbi:OLC1v1036650C1 [Oldenlandia corymbosa var. corymbosa]|uniref:OLC1v1036650C1 n=1 Tax=Oldenlandia corymbosa var. corymbosa TaxID=529605 RepID=A0AAV1CXV9_OLDCO|nr:OLC1v1036650C1 [Oldenlandia corymbosa var. corymbosa]